MHVGYTVIADAVAGDGPPDEDGKREPVDTWRNWSRWQRGRKLLSCLISDFAHAEVVSVASLVPQALPLPFLPCLSRYVVETLMQVLIANDILPACAGLGAYSSILGIEAAFASGAATSFGCNSPV